MPLIEILGCSDNLLFDLDLSNSPELAQLYCQNNSIINLDLSKTPKLNSLNCSDNLIDKLDLSELNNPDIYFYHDSTTAVLRSKRA